ncbi:MAG: hypothetical protein ACPLSK_04715, partial [bacterium]
MIDGKNTAILKPKGYRRYPWNQLMSYRGILLENVVIPERYREKVEALLNVKGIGGRVATIGRTKKM